MDFVCEATAGGLLLLCVAADEQIFILLCGEGSGMTSLAINHTILVAVPRDCAERIGPEGPQRPAMLGG